MGLIAILKLQDCRDQDRECTCEVLSAKCHCGLNGRCMPDGSCHAAECATLGLKECQCVKKPRAEGGSILGDMNMCGICCEIPIAGARPQCVGVEEAARQRLASNSPLPKNWPDEEYRGPNVTIRLCEDYSCNSTWVRAWNAGSVCVTQNVVGICSPRGLCKLDYITPRSNVYPDIMNIRLTGAKNLSRNLKPASIIFFCYLFLLCFIK